MSDYEAALRQAVLGLGGAYDSAVKDLNEVVAEVSEAVTAVSGGLASLVLQKVEVLLEYTTFALYLTARGELHEIAYVVISASGYPIKIAASRSQIAISLFEAVCNSKEEVAAYFGKTLANTNSKLVLRLIFAMRRQSASAPSASGS